MNTIFTSTIGHAWRAGGGENFVLQAGQAGVIQPPHCDQLFRALVEFLRRTGILRGIDFSDEEHEVHHFGAQQTLPLISDHAGFFVSRLDVGRWLQAGDLIGQVYDPFDGTLRLEIKTLAAGLLSGLRRQPLLCEGDLIARIQTRRSLDAAAAPHLNSQGQ